MRKVLAGSLDSGKERLIQKNKKVLFATKTIIEKKNSIN